MLKVFSCPLIGPSLPPALGLVDIWELVNLGPARGAAIGCWAEWDAAFWFPTSAPAASSSKGRRRTPYDYSIPISFKTFHRTGFALKVVQQHILSLQPLLTLVPASFTMGKSCLLQCTHPSNFGETWTFRFWGQCSVDPLTSRLAKITVSFEITLWHTVRVQNPLWAVFMWGPTSTSFSVQLQCENYFNLNTTLIEI